MRSYITKLRKKTGMILKGSALMFLPLAAGAQAPVIQWQKVIGGSGIDTLTSFEATPYDNGYIAGGFSWSNKTGSKGDDSRGVSDYWIVKLDDRGDILWQKTYGGSSEDKLQAIVPVKDGGDGYIVGGSSNSPQSGEKSANSRGGYDYWIMKLNSKGDIEWQKTYGGTENDFLSSISVDDNGDYLVGGTSYSGKTGDKSEDLKGGAGYPDYWVIKLGSDGSKTWDRTIGGKTGSSYLGGIAYWKDGFLLGGHSDAGSGNDKTENSRGGYDYWVVRVDANGTVEWDGTYGGDKSDQLGAVLLDEQNGGYFLAGSSFSDKGGDRSAGTRGGSDYWVVKVDDGGKFEWDEAMGSDANDYLASMHSVAEGKDGYILGGWSSGSKSGEKSEDIRSKPYNDYWLVKADSKMGYEWDKTVGGKGGDDIVSMVLPTADASFIVAGTSGSDKGADKTAGSEGAYDYWIVKFQGCTPVATSETAYFCPGTRYTLPNGSQVTAAGQYTSIVRGQTGCDDTVHTNLIAYPSYTIDITDTICQGGSYRLPDGRTISVGGSYTSGFRTVNGCDSLFRITLRISVPDTAYLSAEICEGDLFTLPGGGVVRRAGTYTDFVGAGAGGCDSVVVTTLNVKSVDPGFSIVAGELVANEQAGDAYQWIDCIALRPVLGETSSRFTPSGSGFYSLAVTKNNCSDTSYCYPVDLDGTGIEDLSDSREIRVYPNPARDMFVVESQGNGTVGELTLYNVLGAAVYRTAPGMQKVQVDVSTLSSGIYTLRVMVSGHMITERIEVIR